MGVVSKGLLQVLPLHPLPSCFSISSPWANSQLSQKKKINFTKWDWRNYYAMVKYFQLCTWWKMLF